MNKQRLQDIASNTRFVDDKDIVDIKQLIVHFPYYKLPYVVLAKIYFEKEHYLFENALTQAAMRVSDREWLYHYVHGEQSAASSVIQENQDFNAETIIEKTEPPAEILPLAVEIHKEKQPLANTPVPEEMQEIFTENTVKDELSVVSLETNEINVPVETGTMKNNISEFLEVKATEETVEEVRMNNIEIEEPVTDIMESESIVNVAPDTNEKLKTEESVESLPESDSAINLAMNLRKHPIYNVEEYLHAENQAEKPSESTEEKDFFYWLQHPKPEQADNQIDIKAPESNDEDRGKDNKFSIIDQFIKANPGITRPKKEFFNAENMAKKSEQVDTDFVTETLANIYYEQGNTELAIKAYEKLSLQNPSKQTYFATLIEKIKKEKK